jgi:hypothetical protein
MQRIKLYNVNNNIMKLYNTSGDNIHTHAGKNSGKIDFETFRFEIEQRNDR